MGCGIVYELSPPTQKGGPWTETILYNFQGGNDGDFPVGDLVFDKHGSLYGATWYGGGQGTTCDQYFGGNCGTVFKLSPPKQKGDAWTEEILHSFAGVDNGQQVGDGADPNGALILDSKGAVYGTTYFGGNNQAGKCEGGSGGTGCGTVFKLIPPTKKGGAWTERLLYLFRGGQDASNPGAGVVFEKNGNLYGTTVFGPQDGWGTIFMVIKPEGKTRTWTEQLIYRFKNGKDGNTPMAALLPASNGDLYSTVSGGRVTYGDVFEVKPPAHRGDSWTLQVLYGFAGAPDAANPAASLTFGNGASLYGTTAQGGTGTACQGGCGTVFEVSP